MNIRLAADDVNINKKLEVEAAVLGAKPNSNIRGAITIPPPTPSIPETIPPRKDIYIILLIFPWESLEVISNPVSIDCLEFTLGRDSSSILL
jgi:hypothetical protein